MDWLTSYSEKAALTDTLQDRKNHLLLLAAGLIGEAGSIIAEIKKMNREAEAYPGYRHRMTEELGDFLWYFVRMIDICNPHLLNSLPSASNTGFAHPADIGPGLDLGTAVGQVLHLAQGGPSPDLEAALTKVWAGLTVVAAAGEVNLKDACEENLVKIRSRWPTDSERVFHPLFDEEYPAEEQIPRSFSVDFLQRHRDTRVEVLLRCNGVNLGARLTDNITAKDDYRYHDIFHIAYAIFLGWSPVVRALLGCKRKSNPTVDENQDGARAVILEEAVSAIVFSRAKQMSYFENANQIEYDLLKNIQEFVQGYEVDKVPLWQWEKAVLEGFRMFHLLRSGPGGRVTWDLRLHTLECSPLKDGDGFKCF